MCLYKRKLEWYFLDLFFYFVYFGVGFWLLFVFVCICFSVFLFLLLLLLFIIIFVVVVFFLHFFIILNPGERNSFTPCEFCVLPFGTANYQPSLEVDTWSTMGALASSCMFSPIDCF